MATEIAEFEGPIHLDRLLRLTAASFGGQLGHVRKRRLLHQIRQLDLTIDDADFVWPSDIDPGTWEESRPNDSAS